MALEAKDLRKSFPGPFFSGAGPVRALQSVSLRLRPGTLTVLTGPNGSGKTTLLKTLAGIFEADGGEVMLAGAPAPAETLRGAAVFLPANPRCFYFRLTAAENLRFFGTLAGLSPGRAEAAARGLAGRLGLPGADLERRFDKLSEGTMQKVSLIRALSRPAAVLLLDEPFRSLDARASAALLELLKERTGNSAILITTHDAGLAARLAADVLNMEAGKLTAEIDGGGEQRPGISRPLSFLPSSPCAPSSLFLNPASLFSSLSAVGAFVRKDFLTEKSYRLSFALGAAATLSSLLVFYFIDRLFGNRLAPHLAGYGTGYFSYVFTATAFFGYIGTGAGAYSERLRLEQTQGTLEAALSTPVPVRDFLLALTAWNFIFATFELSVYALAGLFIFKLDFSAANWPAAALVFALSAGCFASLGILSSCFVMLFKRGNPLAWVLNNFEGLLGGVFFPVAVLPGWLAAVSNLLPVTYAVRAFQLAVHKGAGAGALKSDLLTLAAFDLMLIPAAAWLFSRSVDRARKAGTMGEY